MEVFQPPVPPDSDVPVKHQPRTLRTQMGDGYVQRAEDGINSDLTVASWKWTNLYESEALYILEFFENHKGFIAFEWQRPARSGVRKYICTAWTESWKSGKYCNITAEFEEVVL